MLKPLFLRDSSASSFGVKTQNLAESNSDLFTAALKICPNWVETYTFKKNRKSSLHLPHMGTLVICS